MRLVERGHLSIAAACGCVRRAFTSPQASAAATDLHTAGFLCSSLAFLSVRSHKYDAGIDKSLLQRLYANCGVSLASLVPEVSNPHRAHGQAVNYTENGVHNVESYISLKKATSAPARDGMGFLEACHVTSSGRKPGMPSISQQAPFRLKMQAFVCFFAALRAIVEDFIFELGPPIM